VEVAPSSTCDLPRLKLKRRSETYSREDVARRARNLLAQQGQNVPKENGTVEMGDVITADVNLPRRQPRLPAGQGSHLPGREAAGPVLSVRYGPAFAP